MPTFSQHCAIAADLYERAVRTNNWSELKGYMLAQAASLRQLSCEGIEYGQAAQERVEHLLSSMTHYLDTLDVTKGRRNAVMLRLQSQQ